jgi:mannose-6-phosphate isomerase-like protein (cupin superfamily)
LAIPEEMPSRLVRFADRGALSGPACETSFVSTTHANGCDFDPDQHAGRAEVMIVHSGRWRVTVGQGGNTGALELEPDDVISVPPWIFRTIEPLDVDDGVVFHVFGAIPSERPIDQPAMYSMTADHEMIAVNDGWVIEDWTGNYRLTQTTGAPGVDRNLSHNEIERWRVAAKNVVPDLASPFAGQGIVDATIAPSFGHGWCHDVSIRVLTLQTGAFVPDHVWSEQQTMIMQSGTLEISESDRSHVLGAGDTLQLGRGRVRSLRNASSVPSVVFVVHHGEDPARPVFC